MIVYQAIKAGCGEALLRRTVRLIWRYKGANSNVEGRMPEGLQPKVADDVAVVPCNLPDAPERRMLFSPCWSLLTPQCRTRLGADPEPSSSRPTIGHLANPRPARWLCSLCFIPGLR
jgi:hypothetical protein